ncbi:Pkinase-domain-containing protein [Aureobasidium pullulans]|uniref:non-specific serine/threonine protein kinase n=1 Tax=Aureobasidium pullulans TaxID=5580 RepID=A0A4S8SXW0_AURPU|nr:Pkinase-domain-containing protein [Aureobasidium pullulans]
MASQRGADSPAQGDHSVRFSTQNQEIEPEANLSPVRSLTGHDGQRENLTPQAEEELRQLKTTLQNGLQSKRMEHYSFEPVSLPGSQPVSRVPSGQSNRRPIMPAGSAHPSPRPSPPASTFHSPPLTPSASRSREGKPAASTASSVSQLAKARAAADIVTPQMSASPQPGSRVPSSDETGVSAHPKQQPRFSLGPAGDSMPPSRDHSPNASGASTPTGSGTVTPSATYTKPWPQGDKDDPYARSKRAPPTRNVDSIDARFRFGNRDPRKGHSTSGTSLVSLPAAANNSSSASLKPPESSDKRTSFFGGKKHDHHGDDTLKDKDKAASKVSLKRFFKIGDKKDKSRANSPVRTGSSTPSSQSQSLPFADDHGLASKYGKFGRVLGSGAGGSVRLMKRTADGKTFAVKQFRARHTYESEREYNKKVTAEFCIGSTLHHGNIIETIDIIHEKGNWFEVMEYAPFDLFAIVMTGKMSRDEITCCTLQILSGVLYLHSMGLAHRDLKLDNVVVNDHGIMKIIDFGSAVVFRYPFENDIVLSTGVVGSDPYLAPEVYDNSRYDPQPADIWSIAIIFCCMCLRRFPWKAPRISDNSYRLFVSPPDPGQDQLLAQSRQSITSGSKTENGASSTSGDQPSQQIKGPLRLLRLLPRDTRHIIGRMLDLDPRRRATMDEILADPWVQNAYVCRQEEGGECYHAPGHTHVLEPGGSAQAPPKK